LAAPAIAAAASRHCAIAPGVSASRVFGENVGRRALERSALVPLDLERVAALFRRPEAGRQYRDAVGYFDDEADARNGLDTGGVEALDLGAEPGRMRNNRGEHPGQLDVLRKQRGTVRLRLGVGSRHVLSDVDEVLGILELRTLRHGLLRCGVGKLAERRLLAARMGHDAVFHLYCVGRHLPSFRRGGDQHRARGRTGLPVLLERIRHRGRAAGTLGVEAEIGAPDRVPVTLGVGWHRRP
jgi:hypothetical protein